MAPDEASRAEPPNIALGKVHPLAENGSGRRWSVGDAWFHVKRWLDDSDLPEKVPI